jgi:hypothetical protein
MPSRRLRRLWPVLLVMAAARPALTQGVLLERILAVVDGRPVLLSEVRLVQALRGLEAGAALEELVDERLMLREAGRLAQSAVSPEEEERALAALRESSPAARAAGEPELRRLVRRQAAILKYIDFRFRPQVSASEQDVRRAYDERYQGQTGAPAFEEAAPALLGELARQALDRRVEAWVAELRAAADLRYNAPP